MAFEVIPGGLLLEQLRAEDIPAPDKPASEWTEEETEAYHRYCYENAEPGTIENALKNLAITPETLEETIEALEAIRAALEAEAAATGYRNEWPTVEAAFLLEMLKQRRRSEAGPVPDLPRSVSTADTGI